MDSQFCEHKNKEKLAIKIKVKLGDISKQEITETTYSPLIIKEIYHGKIAVATPLCFRSKYLGEKEGRKA